MYTYEHDEAVRKLLNKRTPALPSELVLNCVRRTHAKADVFLKAREKFGSPLYFLDIPSLLNRSERFINAFSAVFSDFMPYFAMKSCNHPEIIRTLAENGLGIDVSSGAELTTALNCGAKKIVFSGPAKTMAELELAVNHADKTIILCDSFTELKKLITIGKPVNIGVRITTENNPLWRKFGIKPHELEEFINLAENTCADFCGVQFHSSWNLSPDNHVGLIQKLGETIRSLPEKHRKRIDFIDIGGGYWVEEGEWMLADTAEEMKLNKQLLNHPCNPLDHRYLPSTDIETYARALADAVEKHIFPHIRCRIFAEPGRFIAHAAIHLLLTVEDIKQPDIAITDGATNMLGWERYEMDYFPVVNVSQISETEHPMMVLGSLCTPHDVWGFAYHGDGMSIGDLLIVPDQGAYTYSLRQNFIKHIPESVVFDGKKVNMVNCTSIL